MLNQSLADALGEILSLTIAQTEAADEGEWDQVRSMDRRRLELLTNFFEMPAGPAERDVLSEQLGALMQADARLLEVATQARNGIADRMSAHKRQRSGVAAYRKASTHL
ncbi:MAG: flagellar protein FliT [Pseudomonadota bacterium]